MALPGEVSSCFPGVRELVSRKAVGYFRDGINTDRQVKKDPDKCYQIFNSIDLPER